MSDFDKEAERERLREKYEEDTADREVTQQMSELLLRGATMTNKHCEQCSNPIFRYDGQEFCPVCQGGAGGQEAGAAGAAETAETGTDAPGAAGTRERGTAGGDAATEEAPDAGGAATGSGREETGTSTATQAGGAPETAATPSVDADRGAERPDARSAAPERPRSDDPDLVAARAALVRTLTDLADRAETASDVGRQRDLLASAREAAEAIEALDRAAR